MQRLEFFQTNPEPWHQQSDRAHLRPFSAPPVAGLTWTLDAGWFMRGLQAAIAGALVVMSSSAIAGSTYDATLKGKSCSEGTNQQIQCDYRLGNDFWLSIAGVGQSDAGITFMKSDFTGEYYGTYGTMHGCVIVKTGAGNKTNNPMDFAFVSPKNGKVYEDWDACQAAQ
jgi:hypothetical protein